MNFLSEGQLDPSRYGFDEDGWTADPVMVELSDYDILTDAVKDFIRRNNLQPGELISQEELSSALFGEYMVGLNVLIDEVPEAGLTYDEDDYDEDLQDAMFRVAEQ